MNRERGSQCLYGSRPRGSAPPGDGPAPVVGVVHDGARTQTSAGRGDTLRDLGFRTASTLVGLVVAVGALLSVGGLTTGPAGAATASPAAAETSAQTSTASRSTPLLVLQSETLWVTPSSSTFNLDLGLGPGAPASGKLSVSVAVYSCLSTVSAFDQDASSSSGPSGTPLFHTTTPWPALGASASRSR